MLETFGVHPNCVRPWAELLLFDLLPTVMLALGDAWLTAFLWFNQMQYVVLAVELLYPGCYAPDFGDARRDNVVPAPPNAMNGPPPPPPRTQQCGAVDENVPLCDHCLSINVPKVAMRCPSKHRTCLTCLYEHAMVQRSDSQLRCLHQSECGLAFEVKELQSLPRNVLEHMLSLVESLREERSYGTQNLSTKEEEEGSMDKAVSEVGMEAEVEYDIERYEEEQDWEGDAEQMCEAHNSNDDSTIGQDSALADLSEKGEGTVKHDLHANVSLQSGIEDCRVDIRKHRRTQVSVEEVYVTPENVSPGFHQVLLKIEDVELSPLATLGALQLQFTQSLSNIAVGQVGASLDSVTAPLASFNPKKDPKHVSFRASSLPSPDDPESHTLARIVARAFLDRKNAQSRLRYARKKVEAGKWVPEKLDKARRERQEAGEKYERVRGLDVYDYDRGVKAIAGR